MLFNPRQPPVLRNIENSWSSLPNKISAKASHHIKCSHFFKTNGSLGGYCAFQPEPSVISRKSAKKEEATAFWAVASKKFNKCAVAVAS